MIGSVPCCVQEVRCRRFTGRDVNTRVRRVDTVKADHHTVKCRCATFPEL